jgi:hypothetical protein
MVPQNLRSKTGYDAGSKPFNILLLMDWTSNATLVAGAPPTARREAELCVRSRDYMPDSWVPVHSVEWQRDVPGDETIGKSSAETLPLNDPAR